MYSLLSSCSCFPYSLSIYNKQSIQHTHYLLTAMPIRMLKKIILLQIRNRFNEDYIIPEAADNMERINDLFNVFEPAFTDSVV